VGPRTGLERQKNLFLTGIRSRTVQPVVSRYTNCATGPCMGDSTRTVYRCFSLAYVVFRCTLPMMHLSVVGGRVLQTSTQYSSSLQTVCSVSSVVVSMAILVLTFSSGICNVCNKNLKCSIK